MLTRTPATGAEKLPLQAYAVRHGIGVDAFRADGRLTVTFDGRYRVQMRPSEDGQVALTSLLLDLAGMPSSQADEALVRLAGYGCGLMRDHGSGLTLDSADRLLLEQVIPAGFSAVQFDEEVADFLNVLAFWSRTSEQEVGRR